MAMPCSPISPLTITTSPGRAFCGAMFTPSGISPKPLVLIKMPSPCPLSTTLVSPVTSETPAVRCTHRLDNFPKLVERQTSSRINPVEIERLRTTHGNIVDRAVDRQIGRCCHRGKRAGARRTNQSKTPAVCRRPQALPNHPDSAESHSGRQAKRDVRPILPTVCRRRHAPSQCWGGCATESDKPSLRSEC